MDVIKIIHLVASEMKLFNFSCTLDFHYFDCCLILIVGFFLIFYFPPNCRQILLSLLFVVGLLWFSYWKGWFLDYFSSY